MRKYWQDISRGGNFREEYKIAKNAKITPRENFHVYSNLLIFLKSEVKGQRLLVIQYLLKLEH